MISVSVPGASTQLQAVVMTQQSKLQVQSTWPSPTPQPELQELPLAQLTVGSFWLPLQVLSSWFSSCQLCSLHKQRDLHVLSALGLKNIETF